MPKRRERKVILFIVEGESDRIALGGLFRKISTNADIATECRVHPVGTDITSDFDSATTTILKSLHKEILKFLDESGLQPTDIQQVVQITDTDGVFIPDECVIEMSDEEYNECSAKKVYYDDSIHAYYVDEIVRRNKKKSSNLSLLSRQQEITIKEKVRAPYKIFYFSCNLDHYLLGDRNLNYDMKIDCAREFDDYCYDEPAFFYDTICNPVSSAQNVSHAESWDYIKQDCRSLSRYNNVSLLLNYYNELKEKQ